MVSAAFYGNLNAHNKSLLRQNFIRGGCYHGAVINVAMNNWVRQNCP